jgi:hypothetical protein
MKLKVALILLIVQTLLIAGCVAPAVKSELVPARVATYPLTGKSILVAPVTIRPQPKPGFLMDVPPRLDGKAFRAAIVNTLAGTKLFTAVMTQGDADYTLSADVVGQRQQGGTSNIELLLVRYTLSETQSGKELWAGNLLSHSEMSAAEVFMGNERMKLVLQEAARDNLKQLGIQMGSLLTGQHK